MLASTAPVRATDERWAGLYRLGGVAAAAIAVLMLGELAVYAVFRRPDTAEEHLRLFHDNWLAGLLTLDLLGMLAYLLFVPLVLALYQALRRSGEALMAVATALFFLGVADFFATDPAFTVLTLSQEYDAAATEADRSRIVAAAQGMFTQFNENAFLVSYVIVSAAWLGIGVVMLRSAVFARRTAIAGVVAGASGILAVVLEHIPGGAVVLGVAIAFYFVALVALLLWVGWLARPLLRLGLSRRVGEH